jgi:hypothetical protein
MSDADKYIRGGHGKYFIDGGQDETICDIVSVSWCREGVSNRCGLAATKMCSAKEWFRANRLLNQG